MGTMPGEIWNILTHQISPMEAECVLLWRPRAPGCP